MALWRDTLAGQAEGTVRRDSPKGRVERGWAGGSTAYGAMGMNRFIQVLVQVHCSCTPSLLLSLSLPVRSLSRSSIPLLLSLTCSARLLFSLEDVLATKRRVIVRGVSGAASPPASFSSAAGFASAAPPSPSHEARRLWPGIGAGRSKLRRFRRAPFARAPSQ